MVDNKFSLKLVLLLQGVMVLATILDIILARQILGVICLTFFPGYLIIKLLKLGFKKDIDTFVFSFGISIGLVMVFGLIMNVLYPLVGILEPLSLPPILITLSCMNLLLLFINLQQTSETHPRSFYAPSKQAYIFFLLLAILPLSGIIGSMYQNNFLLVFMIFIIAACFLLLAFKKGSVPKEMYPFIIFSISIALIFHTSLISKYLLGSDVNIEYHVFKITRMNSFWNPSYFQNITCYRNINNMNAMLSSTILPTIYSNLLNISEDVFFKIISPFMLSFIPVILYRFYEKEYTHIIALFSVFFFISDDTMFFGIYPINLNRQIFAEIFFILSIFVLFYEDLDQRKRQFLFLFFGSMVMVSHYATSYVYIFYLVFLYVFSRKSLKAKILNSTSLVFLVLIKSSWDVFVSIHNVRQINRLILNLYDRFIVDFFNPAAQSVELQQLYSPTTSGITQLHRVVFYIVNILLLFGMINVFLKRKTSHIDRKYQTLTYLAFFSILLAMVMPNITNLYKMRRFRTFAMFFLSPFIILGGKSIVTWINRVIKKPGSYLRTNDIHLQLLSIILIAYFLFNIGFVNYFMQDKPISTPLDINRKKASNDPDILTSFYNAYIPEQDFFSTIWLSNSVTETATLYADHASRWHVLHSYGLFSCARVSALLNTTELGRGDYLYLSHLNVVEGIITLYDGAYPLSEIALNRPNKIYSNGDSEIYYRP